MSKWNAKQARWVIIVWIRLEVLFNGDESFPLPLPCIPYTRADPCDHLVWVDSNGEKGL